MYTSSLIRVTILIIMLNWSPTSKFEILNCHIITILCCILACSVLITELIIVLALDSPPLFARPLPVYKVTFLPANSALICTDYHQVVHVRFVNIVLLHDINSMAYGTQ